jgi:hypothetical protein
MLKTIKHIWVTEAVKPYGDIKRAKSWNMLKKLWRWDVEAGYDCFVAKTVTKIFKS